MHTNDGRPAAQPHHHDPLEQLNLSGIRTCWVKDLGENKAVYLRDYRLVILDADLTREAAADLAARLADHAA